MERSLRRTAAGHRTSQAPKTFLALPGIALGTPEGASSQALQEPVAIALRRASHPGGGIPAGTALSVPEGIGRQVDRRVDRLARSSRSTDHGSPWDHALSSKITPTYHQNEPRSPRLLELVRGEGRIGPFAAPIGVDAAGALVWHDLHSPTSSHLLICWPAPERFEAIRSVAAGLALTTRPALLQLLTIDSTGRELLVLENLPHAVGQTAIDPTAAALSLRWLTAELAARRREGRAWPGILLVISDLAGLEAGRSRGSRQVLGRILRHGSALGIHVVAGTDQVPRVWWRSGWRRSDVARMTAIGAGEYAYQRGQWRCRLALAALPAVDLDLLARGRVHGPHFLAERRLEHAAWPSAAGLRVPERGAR